MVTTDSPEVARNVRRAVRAARWDRVRLVWWNPPRWFVIVPGDDHASREANLTNWQGVLMVCVAMPVMLTVIALAHLLT